jgi:hypothetical protein
MGDKEKISTFLDLINSQVKTGLLSFLEDSYSKNNVTLNTFLGRHFGLFVVYLIYTVAV